MIVLIEGEEKVFKTHAQAVKFMRTKTECSLSGTKGAWVVRWIE